MGEAQGVFDAVALADELGPEEPVAGAGRVEGGQLADAGQAGQDRQLEGRVELVGAGDGEEHRVERPREREQGRVRRRDGRGVVPGRPDRRAELDRGVAERPRPAERVAEVEVVAGGLLVGPEVGDEVVGDRDEVVGVQARGADPQRQGDVEPGVVGEELGVGLVERVGGVVPPPAAAAGLAVRVVDRDCERVPSPTVPPSAQ